jgi:hypothetical protein
MKHVLLVSSIAVGRLMEWKCSSQLVARPNLAKLYPLNALWVISDLAIWRHRRSMSAVTLIATIRRLNALQQIVPLFDHLVGESEQRRWKSRPIAFAVLRLTTNR